MTVQLIVKRSLLGLLCALWLFSCDERRVYEKNIDLPGNVWHKDSILNFSFNIADAQQQYNIYYNIRNARSYGAQNLYLQVELTDSLGNVLSSDLNNIDLFNSKTGEPLGSGMDVIDYQVPVFKAYQFPKPGRYAIGLQHKMRNEAGGQPIAEEGKLMDIVAMGIRVEKTAQED